MTDYISREAAINYACGNCEPYSCDGACELLRILKQLPAAYVRKVVHGKWNAVKGALHPAETSAVCSNCGFATMIHAQTFYHFCPNCGADMREGN